MPFTSSLTARLGIDHPLIQAPMLGVSTPEMVAAVSNEGGLGSLAIGGLSPDASRQLIRKTRSLTARPFAVNLFAHDVPSCPEDVLDGMRRLLRQLAGRKGYRLQDADLENFTFYHYRDQMLVLLEEEVSLISFTFGCLDAESIGRLKEKGCLLMGTATSLEEALFLRERDVDCIVVQGIEAGGHRGSFLEGRSLPGEKLVSLLPQVVDAVDRPCIAAGGIRTARGMREAFALGAAAVQLGTVFIGTEESVAIPSYKKRLVAADEGDTVLTRAFSGRWARGLRNEMMREIESAGIPIPPYPWQNSLTTRLRKLAQEADDSDYTNLWAGEGSEEVWSGTTKDVFQRLVAEYRDT